MWHRPAFALRCSKPSFSNPFFSTGPGRPTQRDICSLLAHRGRLYPRPQNLPYNACHLVLQGRSREAFKRAGRGAAPAGLYTHRDLRAAPERPPGATTSPCEKLAGICSRRSLRPGAHVARSAVAQRKRPVAQRSMRSGARRRMDAAIGAPEGARAVFGPRAIRICAFRRAIPLGSRGGRKEQTPGASTHRGEEDVCLQALKVRPSSARRSGLREGGSGSAKEKSPSP